MVNISERSFEEAIECALTRKGNGLEPSRGRR
jgi:hypothetical protein